MSYFGRLFSAIRGKAYGDDMMVSKRFGRWDKEAERYDVLDAYRINSDLYGRLSAELKVRGYEGYQSLRNPANRHIEFYASELPYKLYEYLEAEDNVKDLIERVNEWSNWKDRLEVVARRFATHGDLFVKIENSDDKKQVRKNPLDPRHVTDFDKDMRGHFTYLRLDIPQEERRGDEIRPYTRTEVWDKPSKRYFVVEHEEGEDAPLEDLPAPGFSAILTSEPPSDPNTIWTGYDFIPVVHRKLKDTGEERGEGAFQHALDPIDQGNYLATKLFQMLFPDVIWKLTRQPGPGGISLAPAKIETESAEDQKLSNLTRADQESFSVVEEHNQKTIRLPGGADLSPMVPNLDFGSHLLALENQIHELEKDLPELAYYRLREMSEVSGRAARILLDDVITRFESARSKLEDAEIRENKMALTIGKAIGIEGFAELPDDAYESGALDHVFKPYELFPISELERAESDTAEARMLAEWQKLGPIPYAKKLEEWGYEAEEAKGIASTPRPQQTIDDQINQALGQ